MLVNSNLRTVFLKNNPNILLKKRETSPENCDLPLYAEGGWADSCSESGWSYTVNTGGTSAQKSCTDSGFQEPEQKNKGREAVKINMMELQVSMRNAFNQRPTRGLSSICWCMKSRMDRKTSSASCCTFTAKHHPHCSDFWGNFMNVTPSFCLCFLTSNTVFVQTVEEVLMGSRLKEVAPHGSENFLQLQGDVTTVWPHPVSVPPCTIHKPSLLFEDKQPHVTPSAFSLFDTWWWRYYHLINQDSSYLSSRSASSQVAERVCSRVFTQQDRQ